MTRSGYARFVVASGIAAGLTVYLSTAARGDGIRIDGTAVIPVDEDGSPFDGDEGGALVKGTAILSSGGQVKQRFLRAVQAGLDLAGSRPPVRGDDRADDREREDDLLNVQVNDPGLDHVVTFDPQTIATRPFEFSTQSETSAVADGEHAVVGYNSSANSTVKFFPGFGLAFTRLMFSAFSVSHDGGRTWTSGAVPPVSPDAPFTFGDPSLAIDRRGAIYYASLGTDASAAHGTVILNKSVDHGSSFGAATVVAVDDGSDKEWMAIGPDPVVRDRDNIYITWTSYIVDAGGQTTRNELRLARSLDGGQTFSSRTLFAPVADGRNSSFVQFSNPVVDPATGRLYIPFLHFSYASADNVRVLVSDDGGNTFRFLAFNVMGAIDPFGYPNVTPGLLNDCTGGGIRNALVAGADQGGGRFGLPRFRQATRLITQPHAAADGGSFVFVVNSSTSPRFGDPNAGSEIHAVLTRDGGTTWTSTRVAASTTADPQHVHPALSWSGDDRKKTLLVSYYVQQADQRLRVDLATLKVRHRGLRVVGTGPLSTTAFDLTPSNVVRTPTATTNYDRTVATCYDIGEYQALARSAGEDGARETVIAAWGDNRRTWLSPPGSPAAGLHAQPDVFAARLGETSTEAGP